MDNLLITALIVTIQTYLLIHMDTTLHVTLVLLNYPTMFNGGLVGNNTTQTACTGIWSCTQKICNLTHQELKHIYYEALVTPTTCIGDTIYAIDSLSSNNKAQYTNIYMWLYMIAIVIFLYTVIRITNVFATYYTIHSLKCTSELLSFLFMSLSNILFIVLFKHCEYLVVDVQNDTKDYAPEGITGNPLTQIFCHLSLSFVSIYHFIYFIKSEPNVSYHFLD
jgi:hypothetical protein